MFSRFKQMIIKEFRQMLRDHRMRMMIFGLPVIQMVVVAFALTTDVDNITTAVVDEDNTPTSRELLTAFTGSGYFQVQYALESSTRVHSLIDAGKVRAVLTIPSGFERDMKSEKETEIQLLVDATDSNTAAIILGYAGQITGDFAQGEQIRRIKARLGRLDLTGQVSFELRAWYNENLESKYYFVPGLIAVMLVVSSLVLSSLAIVREKEIGTIEQIMVTPIRKFEFILGKTIPYLIVGYIIMTIMLIAAYLIFDIRVAGSLPLLYLLTGIFIAGNLGTALLISVSASTQQQALLTSFFILMPFILLSGFMFPIHNMPVPVQLITTLNPMRWYLEILRGIVSKGAGWESLAGAAVAMSLLAIAFLLTAAVRFRKTLS